MPETLPDDEHWQSLVADAQANDRREKNLRLEVGEAPFVLHELKKFLVHAAILVFGVPAFVAASFWVDSRIIPFPEGQWRQASSKSGNASARLGWVTRLTTQHNLRDMPLAKVKQLLGPPDGIGPGGHWSYDLGSGVSTESEHLKIGVSDGKVASVEIVEPPTSN